MIQCRWITAYGFPHEPCLGRMAGQVGLQGFPTLLPGVTSQLSLWGGPMDRDLSCRHHHDWCSRQNWNSSEREAEEQSLFFKRRERHRPGKKTKCNQRHFLKETLRSSPNPLFSQEEEAGKWGWAPSPLEMENAINFLIPGIVGKGTQSIRVSSSPWERMELSCLASPTASIKHRGPRRSLGQ